MKKLIVSSVLAFITFSAQAAAFQVTSNEIKTGEQLTTWICPYISRHLLSLNPLLACCRRYSRG
ncbi:hypothetical protein QU846_17660, partial [Escherichia coli]|nr:hypothetical protein [Escherichia coli]MDM8862472.1 hypothetical protein [Escherichia coli]MDM8867362.1 hypothetical protein [Escherichia coli]